ncbi:hypothetical protein H2200_005605 [Cladophialophora chaetospira]|uniref:Uncharacterized protein n=1 Tax=Cladophialophora chaetospira TaxID=386627 RepID=A0AA39CK23_9EURO|nr:hypothetical protein H2200_005605 [Cladophialophora chaetospira]
MTLMMAELYSGQSKSWRYHFQGAWDVFKRYEDQSPWEDSDFACASLQSLHIIGIVSDTCQLTNEVNDEGDHWPTQARTNTVPSTKAFRTPNQQSWSAIKSTHDFGFTIGATQEVLECIRNISEMNHTSETDDASDEWCKDILAWLNMCRSDLATQASRGFSVSNPAGYHQLAAFISATFIYFYRTIFDLSPGRLESYTIETLESVNVFLSQGYGNMSLWPAFIASVEACSDKTISMAQTWLDTAVTFGMGSRLMVRKVVEEVWRRRETASHDLGLDKRLIAVDWREVMKELDVDVLLI